MATSSTTYPKKWKTGKTTVIRVPEKLAGTLVNIARKIDEGQSYVFRERGNSLTLEIQPVSRVEYSVHAPVNVSSVPQRSPFRYPGGKTWLIPYIRDWLTTKPKKPSRLIEPFAGGAIVSLTAGFERLAGNVIFAEMDDCVASVWRVVLNGQADWLIKSILGFEVVEDRVRHVLSKPPESLREKAFQTILRNRVNRGGIMAPGAGLIKTGEANRGLRARWYPETIARRIFEINQVRERFTFIEGDGFALISEYMNDEDAVFYVDPPYTLAARRLYKKWDIDHAYLFECMKNCRGDFLMSYDHTEEIVALAKRHGFATRAVAMKNTHHAKMMELLIGRDFSWLDGVSP